MFNPLKNTIKTTIKNSLTNFNKFNFRKMHDRMLPTVQKFKPKPKIIGEKSPKRPENNLGVKRNKSNKSNKSNNTNILSN